MGCSWPYQATNPSFCFSSNQKLGIIILEMIVMREGIRAKKGRVMGESDRGRKWWKKSAREERGRSVWECWEQSDRRRVLGTCHVKIMGKDERMCYSWDKWEDGIIDWWRKSESIAMWRRKVCWEGGKYIFKNNFITLPSENHTSSYPWYCDQFEPHHVFCAQAARKRRLGHGKTYQQKCREIVLWQKCRAFQMWRM